VLTRTPLIERVDLSHRLGNDPAYLAIIDIARYPKDLPDWNFTTLTAKLVGAMNDGAAIAWGTPQDSLTVRLTMTPLDASTKRRVDATTVGRLVTAGSLCLANYTSLTMCAQFEDCAFPQREDFAFELRPGSYDVEIHRLFAHADGEQFAELPPGDHYVVVVTPAETMRAAPSATKIAWALAR